MFLNGAKQRIFIEYITVLLYKLSELCAALWCGEFGKLGIDLSQHFQLAVGHAPVIHQPLGTQGGQARLERRRADQAAGLGPGGKFRNSLGIDVNHVAPIAARRAVGTECLGVRRKQCMQGIQSDHVGAQLGRRDGQTGQVGEITATPVAPRAKGVELDGRSPDTPAGADDRRFVTTLRRHHQAGMPQHAAVVFFQPEVVVAGRQVGQFERQAHVPERANTAFRQHRQLGRRHFAAQNIALFRCNPPTDHRQQRRQHGERDAVVVLHHGDRAEDAGPVAFLQGICFLLQLDGIVHGMAQRSEQAAQGACRQHAGAPAIVGEFSPDAAQYPQTLEQLVVSLSHDPPATRVNLAPAGSRGPFDKLQMEQSRLPGWCPAPPPRQRS